MRNFITVSSLIVVLTGCLVENESGPQSDVVTGNLGEKLDPVIVGDVNWTESSSLPATNARRIAGRPVALLWLPAVGARCTGFLISADVIITNHHCVGQAGDARDAYAVFDAEAGVGDSQRDFVDCSEFIGADATLDMALLRCTTRPGDRHGVVALSDAAPARGDAIYVVHQNCDYYRDSSCQPDKKVSVGNIVGVDTEEYSYDADTLGGSSGAALFDAQNRVVGLHHVGVGGDQMGRGDYNRAVRMNRILPVIQSRYPSVFSAPAPAPSTDTSQSAPAVDPSVDQFEPNNDRATSTTVNVGFDNAGLFIAASDKDMYKLVLPTRRTVRITMNLTHANGDLDLYLYKSGTTTAVAKSDTVTDTESIYVTLGAGTYYIAAVGYQGATGAYRLRVQ